MSRNKTHYLVTGAAGFIGFHTAEALLKGGEAVIGLDDLNEYYDVSLKQARLKLLKKYPNFKFYKADLCDLPKLKKIFADNKIVKVCHLAAQAGVRYSLENPFAYQKANLEGFLNLIEVAKDHKVANFVYASSSSVYGGNTKVPFAVEDNVNKPVSLYAATKRADELIAYTYHHLYKLPVTALRFFTVYGPYGRPDMALFKFTRAILANKPIEVYNFGRMQRDFTYVDDIVKGILSSLAKPYPYEIFNLGNSRTVELSYFIECLEKSLGRKAKKKYLKLQPGDVVKTFADIKHSKAKLGFKPQVKIEEGIDRFVDWYKEYYQIK
ncbi:MAG: GDP-mannose 4,6-dehydratase [Candidatus Margulisiibacteriota bacterium]|jgi:UDP-glucuronate 4-epimerase